MNLDQHFFQVSKLSEDQKHLQAVENIDIDLQP